MGYRVTLLEGDFCPHRLTFKQVKDVNQIFDDSKPITEPPNFSTKESHLRSYKLDLRDEK